ncbi:quinone oxidoreductase family protein [Nocardia nova]|uniref:quinone oxidoreductase family protein n=1 Tax=Nocardia nova TaxID=37330 RepID=UPI0033CAFBBA
MKAAVVTSFESPPRYQDFPDPVVSSDTEQVIDVLAAGLHPRVRSQADGSHYTSTDELPLVPGIDGVGRAGDGTLRYFILPDTTLGAMAERTVIDTRRSIVLPESSDPVSIAAALNPAMSSWVALRQRISFEAGQNILILGATGNAGRMAVQIAKLFGANQIIAAARDVEQLAELGALGATETVRLDDARQLGKSAAQVDVVIDYVWGQAAADAMIAVITERADRGTPLSWIQIGSVAGPTAPIPSAALRAARLQIVGSGQGSVGTREILTELPALAEEITRGTFRIEPRTLPLAQVEQAWAEAVHSRRRIVITP